MGIIGNIRKHSWIAVVLVGVATLSFILGDLTNNGGRVPNMGEIDGNTITNQRFEGLYADLKGQIMRQQGVTALTNEQEYQVREQVWQNLTQEILLGEQYDKLGIAVSNAELNDMYTGEFIHPYLKQIFTDPQTGEYLTQSIRAYTENFDQLDTLNKLQWIDVERTVTMDREQQKYGNMIAQAMYLPKPMAEKIAVLNSNSSNVRVAAMSFYNIADDQVHVTNEDYKKYYNEHKAEYRVFNEMRQLDYVIFPVNPTQEDYINIEKDVNRAWAEFQTMDTASALDFQFFVNGESTSSYDTTWHRATDFAAPLDSLIATTNVGGYIAPRVIGDTWVMGKVENTAMRPDSLRASSIWVLNQSAGGNITRSEEQAKAMADSAMALLKSGALTFDQAVLQFSDNKENNGDMGWALDGGYGFLNDKILETPVDGYFLFEHPQKFGYMIVKVTGKTALQKKYRVALVTKNIVPSKETEEAVYNAANMFAGQNRTHAAMIAAAQEQNLQVHSDNVSRMSQSVQGVQGGREVVRWAFDEEVEVGNTADKLFTADNMYVVCALKDVLKKGFATETQARPFMEQQVRLAKKGDVALEKVEQVCKAAKDINTIAADLGTTVDTVTDVTFNGYYFGKFGMEPKVQVAVAMNAAKNNTQILAPIKGASGVYVVQIDNVTAGAAADGAAVQASFKQNAMQKNQNVLETLRLRAKIEDNREKFF